MRSVVHKSERLAQLENILRRHPEGVRRAELARRLGLHRSTIGRYIDELSRTIPIWEEDYLIRIKLDEGPPNDLDLGEAGILYLIFKSVYSGMTNYRRSLVTIGSTIGAVVGKAHPTLGQAMKLEIERYRERFADSAEGKPGSDFETIVESWCRSLPVGVRFKDSSPFGGKQAVFKVSALQLEDRNGAVEEVLVHAECFGRDRRCTFKIGEVAEARFASESIDNDTCSDACALATASAESGSIHHQFRRILIVDDESTALDYLRLLLADDYARIETSQDVEHALEILAERPVDLVICDLFLDGESGLEVVRAVKERRPATGCIIVTGKGGKKQAVDALRAGADDYLEKPLRRQSIESSIRRVEARVADWASHRATFGREANHRVRNQLALLASLINWYNSRGEEPREALESVLAKIKAMGSFLSGVFEGELELRVFADALADGMNSMFGTGPTSLTLTATLERRLETIRFGEDVFRCLSLVVAELCTNTVKHGRGHLSATLTIWGGVDGIHFRYCDGHEAGDEGRAGTGTELIEALAAQCHGEYRAPGNGDKCAEMLLPYPPDLEP